MNNVRALLLSIIFAYFGKIGSCTPNDSLAIKLTIQNKEISRRDDLKISLIINSFRHQSLLLPDADSWGLMSSHDAFYLIQIQRKAGDKFVDLDIPGHLDLVPNLTMDTLKYNQERKLNFAIYILTHYTKGDYRMRVLCRFSALNDLQDKYSNWIYFTCKNDIEGTY